MLTINDETEHLITELSELSPQTRAVWDEFEKDWGDDRQLRPLALTYFGRAAVDFYKQGNLALLRKVLRRIDRAARDGKQYTQEMACTVFLESFWDEAESVLSEIERVEISTLLGEESRQYLKAWSEFWSVPFP